MKSKMYFFFLVLFSAALLSCSDDDEVKRKGDPDLTHEGTKWKIASIDYNLFDQSFSGTGVGQTIKEGTKENAGTFYFVEGGDKGSFELEVEGFNKEDVFSYEVSQGSVNISQITQSVGITTNQNVVEIDGSQLENEMELSGLISKQSTTGQFVLTINSMVLVKQ